MRKIDRLRKEALQSCKARGHVMGRFIHTKAKCNTHTFHYFAYAECKECKASVHLETHPAPNSIDIGGAAVAVNCPAGFKAVYGRDPIPGVDFDPNDSLCQDDYEYLTSTGRYKS